MSAPPVETLEIKPFAGPVDGEVVLPGSKSYTNRALAIAALADGRSTMRGALFSDDTAAMADSLRRLGIRVEEDPEACRFDVYGQAGRLPATEAELFVGNAGTAARFLTAMLALGHGRYRLDGAPRMRERPIQPLLDALESLGTKAYSEAGTGCPPIIVESSGLQGGRITVPGQFSSQYFSALLMVGPLTPRGLVIDVEGELVSKPYIDMTAAVMASFGVTMENDGYQRLTAPGGQRYQARDYLVEPDASGASYFFALPALCGGRLRVNGLGRDSRQGDLAMLEVLEQMGAEVERGADFIEVRGDGRLRGVEVDANAFSDVAQTLAAVAVFAEGPTTIRNIAHVRHKETDRIQAMVAELRRLGQEVQEFPDGLRIEPRPVRPATVRTYDDHRMAMSLALIGLRAPGVTLEDPGCVAKTFPDFFQRLESLRPATTNA